MALIWPGPDDRFEELWNKYPVKKIVELYGGVVKEVTVRSRAHRQGLEPKRNTYDREKPWRVKADHDGAYELRMLRVIGRERVGAPIEEDLAKELESYRRWFASEQPAVIAYLPDSHDGFAVIDPGEVTGEIRDLDGTIRIAVEPQRKA